MRFNIQSSSEFLRRNIDVYVVPIMHCISTPTMQKSFNSKDCQISLHIYTNYQTNTRHVCTHLNAFLMLKPNPASKCNNFESLWIVFGFVVVVDEMMSCQSIADCIHNCPIERDLGREWTLISRSLFVELFKHCHSNNQ